MWQGIDSDLQFAQDTLTSGHPAWQRMPRTLAQEGASMEIVNRNLRSPSVRNQSFA